jgi:CBS domain-containing protein
MTEFRSIISKLAEETNLIAFVNPSHRINIEVNKDFVRLVRAINKLADRYEELSNDVQQKIQLANAETEAEKSILAAVMSELPEGVLICNAEGQILLYNNRARQFLEFGIGKTDVESSYSAFHLGRSVFTVIDKNLIEHALDEINEKLKREAADTASYFVAEGKGTHLLQAQVVPILNRLGQFTGFILILNDITRQREADNRVDSLLRFLTRSARSPLASIRSAIEVILEYPDMESAQLKRFREIISKESIVLSDILNQFAADYSALVKTRWSLLPMSSKDLIEMIARRARDRLGILVSIEEPVEKTWVKVDTYSMIMAILFVMNQLNNETGTREFICKLEKEKGFVNLDLLWQGDPVRMETARQWEDQFLMIDQEKSPLTLKEVLEHHGAEMWSYARKEPEDKQYIRFLLPADEAFEPEDIRPITILPESSSGFYDFELFKQPGQNPELDNRLLTELTYTVLTREISETDSIEEVIGKQNQLPGLIRSMISGGAKVRNVTWLITTFSDAILKKLVSFAVEELGPPPTDFAFVILGSAGRKEQTLKTDQDNAVIFKDVAEGSRKSKEEVNKYFLELGEKVCIWLDQAGYDLCTGDIMAKNPKWCQPLSVWKKYFSDWIHAAEPEDLLHSSIFFDFRFAYGDSGIVDNLSKYLFDSLIGWSGFFRHMTENTLYFKPPIGFFGNFIVETKGKHRKCLDIKYAMTPVVDFARIYALKNNIRETNTQERLYQLYLKKVLSRQEYNEIEQGYSYMMQLRFVRQIASVLEEDTKPDNYINPKKLSSIERKMLKEAFKRVEKIQTKLSFEFTGMSDSHMRQ